MHPLLRINSFGCHCSEFFETAQGPRRFHAVLKYAQKISLVVAAVLGSLIVAHVIVLNPAIFWAGLGVIAAISAAYYSEKLMNYYKICKTAGILFDKPYQPLSQVSLCQALATEHSADTELWRNEMVKRAEHNIVVSGNYCGGESFVEFLDLIEERLQEKPALKVILLSSPHFLDKAARKKLDLLSKKYPANFSLIQTPDIWHLGHGIKRSTNHTKCTLIDYGKYFILGGSGIKDNFVSVGLLDLAKEVFLQQKGKTPRIKKKSTAEKGSFLNRMLPGSFRDMDFVFHDTIGNVGRQVYQQMLLLSHRWEQYHRAMRHPQKYSVLKRDDLGVLNGHRGEIYAGDSLTVQMMKTPIPAWRKIATQVPRFKAIDSKAAGSLFQLFASGPEQNASAFAEELLREITQAKRSIVIDQMYFHPTPEIMEALIAAVKRGVKITLITCGVFSGCPMSHKIFGPRNKYNYLYLRNAVPLDKQDRVQVYEFEQAKNGLHKKVIVIDGYVVIAGSSNLGYKSLVTTSDHELNFIAKSSGLAEQVLSVCAVDQQHSRLVLSTESLSPKEYFMAFQHRCLAPLIG